MKKRRPLAAMQQQIEARKYPYISGQKSVKSTEEKTARPVRRKLQSRKTVKSQNISLKQKLIDKISDLSENEICAVYVSIDEVISHAKTEITGESEKAPPVIGPPLPSLSEKQISEISSICKKWDKEKKLYRGRVFDWVKDNFQSYIPGLLQSHLRANMNLYRTFMKGIERNSLPDDLDVPNEPDANLRNEQDPTRRAALLEARRMSRGNMHIRRHLLTLEAA